MSDSLGSIWVMDVFLIYKWWCVWHQPELWVNLSGPYKWSLNADYQSERWLWFLESMSVGSYLGIKLKDAVIGIWLNVVSLTLSDCNPDEWWLQTWLYLTCDWMLDIHNYVACFLNFWVMCVWVVTKPMANMSDSLGYIWVMDVFLIYKWWCVWRPPELWVNLSGPYQSSLNADYRSERWLWF